MAEGNVFLAKQVDVRNLKYSPPRTLSNGSKTVYINYNSSKLSIQTPVMRFPYGIGEGYDAEKDKVEKKESEQKRYDLNVSFVGYDENPKMKHFLDLMVAIENKIKKDAFENRVEWLGDDYDGIETVVGKLFTPIVKYDKDKVTKKVVGKYPPTMKLKLPYDIKNDTFSFSTQDMDGNDVDFKAIMRNLRGGRGKLIIQLGGLWFAGGKYGCTWKVASAKLEEAVQRSIKFIEESDDEDEKKPSALPEEDEDVLADAMENATVDEPPKKKSPVVVEDSEDEEDSDADSDISEPPPPPSPPKKGKKGARK